MKGREHVSRVVGITCMIGEGELQCRGREGLSSDTINHPEIRRVREREIRVRVEEGLKFS